MVTDMCRLLFVCLLAGLAACTYRGYPLPDQPATPQPKQPQVAAPARPAAAQAVVTSCPDTEVTQLLIAGEYQQAKQLLDEDLARARSELARSCVLASMGLLSALPDAPHYNLQRVADFQSLARVNNAVKRGGLELQLLDTYLTATLQSRQQLDQLRAENDELRNQLKKTQHALEKLKQLTLGGGG